MNGLRLAPMESSSALEACSRCSQGGQRWDRIAGHPFCPQCQESLALGESEPLVLSTIKKHCAVCDHLGSVCFHTFPLQKPTPVEMDLCAEHLRCLLGRRLGPHAYHQLRRQLDVLGVDILEIFLLHEAFYDLNGKARQPVIET